MTPTPTEIKEKPTKYHIGLSGECLQTGGPIESGNLHAPEYGELVADFYHTDDSNAEELAAHFLLCVNSHEQLAERVNVLEAQLRDAHTAAQLFHPSFYEGNDPLHHRLRQARVVTTVPTPPIEKETQE